MKRLVILAIAALGLVGCDIIKDIPAVKFTEKLYTVTSEGQESFFIPVSSTGIDDVIITFERGEDKWEIDPTNGNRIPAVGWVKLVQIIEHYEQTRDLAQWTSGIELKISPNDTDAERVAYITVKSFQAQDTAIIRQGF